MNFKITDFSPLSAMEVEHSPPVPPAPGTFGLDRSDLDPHPHPFPEMIPDRDSGAGGYL
jgi:hypothetical protein